MGLLLLISIHQTLENAHKINEFKVMDKGKGAIARVLVAFGGSGF